MVVKKETKKTEVKKEEIVANVKKTQDIIEEEIVQPRRLSIRKNKNEKIIDIDKERTVPVVSVVNFTVGHKYKDSGKFIKWNAYGDEHYMKIGDIVDMMRESDKFLKQPWLIVDDEEFAKAYDLTGLYELVFDLEDLESFFKQSIRIVKNKLDSLSVGMRSDILNRAVQSINSGEINDMNLVKMLKREYGIDIVI